MSSDEDKKREMQVLCRLITWFDGYANLSCVDPIRIEKAMKFCGEDVQRVWDRIRDDVYSIGKLPGASQRILRLGKIVNLSRFFFVGFALLAIVFWLLASELAPKLLSGPGTALLVLVIIAIVFNADVVVYILSTRRLSAAVNEYFQTHRDEAKFQRRRVKEAAQTLIDKLALRVRSSEESPEGYEFTLLDQNYANVKVAKEKNLYTATVRWTAS